MDNETMEVKKIKLPLVETFFSIQGEGYHAGMPAWFIRLAGCDVGCIWCDETNSWNAKEFQEEEISNLIASANAQNINTVIITGGEPMLYDLTELTLALKNSGLITHLETSGAYPLTGTWDWITFSPKKFEPPFPEYFQKASELKIIVFNSTDFNWAEKQKKLVSQKCKLYLQPEWSRQKEMIPLIFKYLQKNPEWRLSLQMHKYIGMP